jgi:hypothetical protein
MVNLNGGVVPHPDSYNAVMNFLQSNPEIVSKSLNLIMNMTGATCPKSTAQAVSDFLRNM